MYLRDAARSVPDVTGVGLEVSAAAADLCRLNLAEWGLAERFIVVEGDIRTPPSDLGRFDLVTLFHNIYYFDPAERPHLFETLRSLLTPRGALAIVCYFSGRTKIATHFDLILRSTKGNTALPDLDVTIATLRSSGFDVERPKRLVPLEPLYGLVARRGRNND